MLPFIVALVLYECTGKSMVPGDHDGAVKAIETSVNKAIRVTGELGSDSRTSGGPSEADRQVMKFFLRKVLEQLGEIESKR